MTNSEDPLGTKPFGPTVFISNLSEDVWPFIQAFSDPKARQSEIDENATLFSDRDLFSNCDVKNLVFISPEPIQEDFLAYYKELFERNHIQILVPNHHTGEICKDILRDKTVLDKLIALSGEDKKLTLTSYSTSHQFLELVEYLQNQGLTIDTPEAPTPEDAWTVNFFGSKSGIRQLAQLSSAEEPDFIMPGGYICSGIEDAAKIAAQKYLNENGVVIKTNKGHCGMGVLIFRPGELASEYSNCKKQIHEALKKDEYWDKFPIIVEKYINVNPFAPAAFPNVEFKILKSGQVEFLYPCSMRVTKDGVFRGIEVGEDIMSDQINAQIVDTGFYVGEQYAKNGYRGYFEIDFIKDRNIVYTSESNVRRTGGTHLYITGKKLLGEDVWEDYYMISFSSYFLPEQKPSTFKEIHSKLQPVLYDKKNKEGLIIVSANLMSQGRFGYIILGKSKKKAQEIESHMESLLR